MPADTLPIPLRILLSRDAAARFGADIRARVPGLPLELVPLEDGDGPVDAAFLTKDVSGRSTKTSLSVPLARFFDRLRESPGLRWVHTHSAGADRPIYPELMARGVTVTTSSGLTADTVAQSVLAGLLSLARRLPMLAAAQRRKAWEPLIDDRAPRDLKGQHAVVVGMGPIGREIARLLDAVGLTVTGVRTSAAPTPHCRATVAFPDLPRAVEDADWLILACPLTDTTRRLVDAKLLATLPRGAHLINVSRGEVAVERDVIDALSRGHLAGAFLDVFELEPLSPDSPLWQMDNVIVTPHTASHSTGYYTRVATLFVDNLVRFRAGEPLVNDAARYR